MRTTKPRWIRASMGALAVASVVGLAACGPSSGSGVGSAEPSSSGAEASVGPSPEASGESTSRASESSVGSSPGASVEPSSRVDVVEDPRWPAPVLVGWDPSLSEFAGMPPPVVFASLFDGRLPAADPAEVGGFAHVVDEWSTVFSRARIYQERQDRGASYDLQVQVNSVGMYGAFVSASQDIEQVGFATCSKVPHPTCVVVADDGVIRLTYVGNPPLGLEAMVAELGKLVEFYAND
uniref:hypothetical protein n=1 Tax=Tessaracoccus timonensis TaxID=2161816 RepID=UPI00131F006B|nr:hypothetical protein [Tessaracoccus timonensis]